MSTTHHELFSNTLQKTHIWLKDLMEELWWEDEHRAYLALRATLHALRDRLTVEDAEQRRKNVLAYFQGLAAFTRFQEQADLDRRVSVLEAERGYAGASHERNGHEP